MIFLWFKPTFRLGLPQNLPFLDEHFLLKICLSIRSEKASFGPCRRSPVFEILNVAVLRLRFQKRFGLDLNQNLPFLNEHLSVKKLRMVLGPSDFVSAYVFLFFVRPKKDTILKNRRVPIFVIPAKAGIQLY